MSGDSNKYQDSEGVYPPSPTSRPPKQEVLPPPPPPSWPSSVQGYYEAGPYVAPPPVSDPMKYGPQHLHQPPPPPPPGKANERDDEFCTGCCCCL